jgi:hypothetical protein
MANIKCDIAAGRGRWRTVLSVIPILLLAACAADSGDESPGDPQRFTAQVSDHGVVSEISDLAHVVAPSQDKAGCTHIRFCTTPGTTNTITCDTDDKGCTSDQRFNECISDANFVCGRHLPMAFDPGIPCPVTGVCSSGTLIGIF